MEIVMDIAGLGIIIYSPSSALHIAEGENYLEAHFWDPADVAEHVMAGGITAFATSSPGTYQLRILEGYPPEDRAYDSSLRLGLRCDGVAIFKDLYELMDWTAEYSRGQAVEMPAGNYHVTVCTTLPESGIIGDDQMIGIYFQPLDEFPALRWNGVPTLCE